LFYSAAKFYDDGRGSEIVEDSRPEKIVRCGRAIEPETDMTKNSRADEDHNHIFSRRWAARLLAIGFLLQATAAQTQSDDRVKTGLMTWRSSGCADCHGAFADGDKQRDEALTGANLRTTRLDAAALKQTISCGRPGTGMPAFDEGAYQIRACNEQPLGPPPSDLYPTPRTLTPDQIDAVVTYLQARVIGKGRTITKQECLFYYDDQPEWCDDYK
jgi:mono/diheme cytochrome c family protein